MGFKQTLSKGLRNFGGIKVSHGAVITYTALLLVLFIAFTIRVLPMRWEIPQGTLGLNEFDPYYQYTATNHMVQNGLLSLYYPHPWIDTQQFFPGGIDFSGVLPSLPTTAAALYDVVHGLGVNIDLMSFCSILAPILGTLAVFVMYFIGKDFGGKSVGLLAALILALSPSIIQRSSLGFFDTETVGVLGLLLFIYAFLRAIEPQRSLRSMTIFSLAAGGALAYFAAGWGGAYYLIGLAALFVFILIVMKRYSQRLLLSYSITFGLGFFLAIAVPYLSVHYLTSGVVLPVAGVFALLCFAEVYRAKVSARGKTIFVIVLLAILVGGFAAIVAKGGVSSIAEKFSTVLNPLQRATLPIIASVAEQRITAWAEIYSEVGIGILFFLMGLYFMVKNPTNRNVFLVIFGLTALYFAGSMVRLLVVLAPASALLGSMAVAGLLKPFYTLLKESGSQASAKSKRGLQKLGKEYSAIAIIIVFLLLMSTYAYSPQTGGQPRVFSAVYSPITISVASLPIAPNEPVPQWRNMLSWTRNNLQSTTVVSSWWDYGDWLGMFGNVTTLCDNTTTNTTQIENVAYSMMANETQSLKMLAHYNVSYVLVFVTLQLKLSSDQTQITGVQFGGYGDEGKWPWMARISGEAETRLMGSTTFGESWMNSNYSWLNDTTFAASSINNSTGQQQIVWTDMGLNSTVYKLMYDAESRYATQYGISTSETAATAPTYFSPAYIAGLELTPSESGKYGLLVPLVALYKINWDAYNTATNSTVSISP
jgi:dolichyl-diphosphooligosaccharide--protein glycosyltransferase